MMQAPSKPHPTAHAIQGRDGEWLAVFKPEDLAALGLAGSLGGSTIDSLFWNIVDLARMNGLEGFTMTTEVRL